MNRRFPLFFALAFLPTFIFAQTSTDLDAYWRQLLPNAWLTYVNVSPVDSNYAVVNNFSGQQGLIDRSERLVIPMRGYINSACSPYGHLCAYDQDSVFVYRRDHTLLFTVPGTNVGWDTPYFESHTDDGLQLIDTTGNSVALPKVKNGTIETQFIHGFAAAQNSQKEWGLVNTSGEWVIQPQFAALSHLFQDHWTGRRKDWKTVLVNPAKPSIGKKTFDNLSRLPNDTLGFWDTPSGIYYGLDEQPRPEKPMVTNLQWYENFSVYTGKASNLYGLMDTLGTPLTPPVFYAITPAYSNCDLDEPVEMSEYLLVSTKADSTGLHNGTGWVLPPRFSYINLCGNSLLAHTLDSVFLYVHDASKLSLTNVFPTRDAYLSSGVLHFNEQHDSVWILNKGWMRIPNGYAFIDKVNNYWIAYNPMHVPINILDAQFKPLLPANVRDINNGHYMLGHNYTTTFARNGQYGWLDHSTGRMEQPQYGTVQPLERGMFLVNKNLRYGLVKANGTVLVPINYEDYRTSYNSNLVLFRSSGIWKAFTYEGKAIYTPPIKEVSLDGCPPQSFWGKTEAGWQLYDESGRARLPFAVEQLATFNGDHLTIKNPSTGKYGLISQKFTVVQPFEWDSLSNSWGRKKQKVYFFKKQQTAVNGYAPGQVAKPFTTISNLYGVQDNGKWGIYRDNGELLLPPTYDILEQFTYLDAQYLAYKKGWWGKRGKDRWDELDPYGKVTHSVKADTLKVLFGGILAVRHKNKKFLYRPSDKKQFDVYVQEANLLENKHYLVSKDGLYGIMDENFKTVIPIQFNGVRLMQDKQHYEVYGRRNDGVSGLYDVSGKVCIPVDQYWSGITELGDGLYAVNKDGQTGVYSAKDKKWTPTAYEDIQSCNIRIPLAKSLFLIRVGGLYGIMDADCKQVIAPTYRQITPGSYLLSLLTTDSTYFLYNPKTNTTYPTAYKWITEDGSHFFGGTGTTTDIYLNTDKVSTIPYRVSPLYINQLLLTEDTRSQKKGLCNYSGTIILPTEFNAVQAFEKCIVAAKNDSIYLYNEEGKKIDNLAFTQYEYFNWNYLKMYRGKQCGLYHTEGTLLLPIQYEDVKSGSDGVQFLVKSNGKWQLVTRGGQPLLNGQWDDLDQFNMGLAAAKKGDKWGYIDLNGQWAIPPVYDYADRFYPSEQPLAAVVKDGKELRLSITGQELPLNEKNDYVYSIYPVDSTTQAFKEVPFKHVLWESSYHGLIMVETESHTLGAINILGQWVLKPVYQQLTYEQEGIIAQKDNKKGMLDLKGNVLLPFDFEEIENLYNGKFRVEKDGTSLIFNKKGEKVED